jgi:hypothetical protein
MLRRGVRASRRATDQAAFSHRNSVFVRPHHSLRSAPQVPAKGGFGYSLWLSEAYPLLSATGSTIAA